MIRSQSQLTITIDLLRPILRIDLLIRMDSKNDFLVLIFALWSEFQSKISVIRFIMLELRKEDVGLEIVCVCGHKKQLNGLIYY